MVYIVPAILFTVALAFGIFWIWICGGLDKYEVVFGGYKKVAYTPAKEAAFIRFCGDLTEGEYTHLWN